MMIAVSAFGWYTEMHVVNTDFVTIRVHSTIDNPVLYVFKELFIVAANYFFMGVAALVVIGRLKWQLFGQKDLEESR